MTSERIPPRNWYVGMVWRQLWLIKHPVSGDLVDPAAVIVTVYSPQALREAQESGSEPEGEVVTAKREAQGEYLVRVPLTEEGEWEADIETTGEYEGVKPARISVKRLRPAIS